MSIMRQNIFRYLVLILLLIPFFTSSSFAASAVRINRLRIEEKLLPGETKEGFVEVTNSSPKEVMHLKAYSQDWCYSSAEEGSKEFAPPGTFPHCASEWLTLYPEELTLPPKSSAKVRYTISAPADAQGGYHSVIFFENTLSSSSKKEDSPGSISARIACLVYVDILGTLKKDLTISSLDLKLTQNAKTLELRLDLENSSNTHFTIEPTYHLLNEQGAMAARGTFSKSYLLPEDKATAQAKWIGALSEGSYHLVVSVDLGEENVLVKEWKITVSPGGMIRQEPL